MLKAVAITVAADTVVIIAATAVAAKSENAVESAAVNGLGFGSRLMGKVKVEAVARPQPTLPPTALLHRNSTLLPPQAVLHSAVVQRQFALEAFSFGSQRT